MFWTGLLLGFSIAAPVGPIGVLCIRRTLADGRATGFVSGLGAASADALYGMIAGLGLSAVSGLLVSQQTWLRLLGGLFLCYLGARTFVAQPAQQAATAGRGRGLAAAYLSTFLLTITNPATILSFLAVFAGLGLAAQAREAGAALALVAGVFCGSALWWLTLSSAVGLFRSRIGAAGLRWINRASGVIIVGFGGVALASLLLA